MSEKAPSPALRFGCGAILGAVLGLVLAPRLLRVGRLVGVDPTALAPALALIAVAAIAGGIAVMKWRWRP
jgi:hypothetical protein